MRKFEANRFLNVVRGLQAAQLALLFKELDKKKPPTNRFFKSIFGSLFDSVKSILEVQEKTAKLALEKIKIECETLGLDFTLIKIEEALGRLESNSSIQLAPEDITTILDRLSDELNTNLIFQLNPQNIEYYASLEKWKQVTDKFPKTSFDIDEAGKCFSQERYTACVFHLMRVFEQGIHEIAKSLAVTLNENQGWHKHLDKIDSAIEVLPDGNSTEKKRKKEMQQARSHLHGIRQGWRNDTMHPKDTYTEEEAKTLYHHTKAFMCHLVDII